MKYIKIICILILLIFVFPGNVFAAGYIDENPSAYPSCGAYTRADGTVVQLEWCYTSVGYRFSLYHYDGTTLTKKGKSFDTTTQHTYNFVGRRALKANSQTLGRLDYTELGKSINWTSTYYTLNYGDSLKDATGSATYSLAPPMDNNTGRTVRGDIEEYFFLDGGVSNDILNRLKSLFDVTSLTLSDISKLYITVEPTIYFYKATGTGGYAYYGTVYEILNIPASAGANTAGGASLFGINGVIYKDLPLSLITVQGGLPADPNRLVGTSSSVKIKFASSDSSFTSGEYSNSDRQTNRGLVFAEGYGIGVYKIFDYTTADCSSACSSYTIDSFDRLKCAENYCHDSTSSVSDKESCIIACGYAKPGAIACTATSTPNSSSTCAGKVSASKTTCSVTTDKYFTTECIETTTLAYPDLEGKHNLLLNKRYDFPYVVYTEGTKKCTKKFNYKLFQFDYATKRTNTQRTNLKNDVFNRVYFKTNDTDIGSHKYNETWQTLKLNNSAQDYSLTWVNGGTNTYISSTSTQNFRVLANGSVSWINGEFNKKVYQSNNTGTVIVNEPLRLPSARIPFITNTDTSKTNVVKIKKDSSNLDSTNRCNYQPTTSAVDLKCYAKEVRYPSGRTSNAKVDYVIEYTTRSNSDAVEQKGSHSNLQYSFDGINWGNVNNTFKVTNVNIPYSAGKAVTKVMTVKAPGGKTVTCSAVASFDGATCNIRLSKQNINNADFYDDKIKVSTNASNVVCKRQNGTTISALNADGRSIYTSSILSATSPHEIITCTGTTSAGAVCSDQISTGTCAVYKPNDYTNISKYCTEYGVIDGYASDQNCISKCSGSKKCPSCPFEATNSQVNNWCSITTNLTNGGYVNKEQCLNECSCKGELGEYIFRPVTLGKKSGAYLAFPNRTPGGNWVGVEKKTETTTFSEPIYVINLDKDTILKIRNNTSANKSTAYIPYEQLTKEQKKADFNSSFLNGLEADEFCETTPARRCS